MKAKYYLMITAAVILGNCILTPASWADSARQHRLEGAAMVIGAMVLTKAILDHHEHINVTEKPVAAYRHHRRPDGHWRIKKEWVSPKYKKVWRRGHYNHRGHWVTGHWKRIQIEPGYWMQKRVWIAYNGNTRFRP